MDMNKLYIYDIIGQASGVVIADSEDDGVAKVIKAYGDHGDDLAGMEVYCYKAVDDNRYFEDNPDVVEVMGMD